MSDNILFTTEEKLFEEQRVGEIAAKALTSASTTNEVVINVLFNLLLSGIEDGHVTGSVASKNVTLTISYNNEGES